MLLLWLVIICKIPFDLKRFDADRKTQESTTIKRLMAVSRKYMESATSDRCGEMAALVMANLLIRPDVKDSFLESEIKNQLDTLEQLKYVKELVKTVHQYSDGKDQKTAGILHIFPVATAVATGKMCKIPAVFWSFSPEYCLRFLDEERRCIHICILLAQILKQGKREDLLPYAPFVLAEILKSKLPSSTQTLLRKQAVKLVQRVGLLFLKPRVASWRYQRGNRSITQNLKKDGDRRGGEEWMDTEEADQSLFHHQEDLGNIIEFLLQHLRDRETVVRWSSAKGLGRVTSRLPRDMADEVVSSILELFSIRESDAAWHGGCLSLAELGRRGFLLPSRLPEVLPIVLKALNYEEQQGRFSIGAHVRDAGCYLCWSFARAYNPEELQPHVPQLASALLAMTVFDREINCRRAASAAFQENVGRQGSFPHGIDILTVADYFAVGQRAQCYKELSVYIASFPEYTETLVSHLVDMKVGHWDLEIRVLAAEALGSLTEVAPKLMEERMLPKLIKNCSEMDLFLRQGSMFGVAEIAAALMELKKKIGAGTRREIVGLPREVERKQFLKGMGQDLIRSALNTLMEKLARVEFPMEETEELDSWHRILEENLSYSDDKIREGAAVALAPFCGYYRNRQTELDGVIRKFVAKLKTGRLETERIGAALALGNLPKFVLEDEKKLAVVIDGLVKSGSSKTEADKFWAQARKDSILAIGSVMKTVAGCTGDTELYAQVFKCYTGSLSDYTTDSRGDIGRIVREAGLSMLTQLLVDLGRMDGATEKISESQVLEAVSGMIRQCCEKIDSTRKIAAEGLAEFVHDKGNKLLGSVPDLEVLGRTFTFPGSESEVKWMSGAEAFPRLEPLLSTEAYHSSALRGFLVSAGGMTESTMKTASDSLLCFVSGLKDSGDDGRMETFLETFTSIAEEHKTDQRIIAPLLNVLDQILACDYLDMFNGRADECQSLRRLLDVSIEATAKKKNVIRVLAGLSVFCSMLQFESTSYVWQRSMRQTLLALTHPYLKVRRGAASKLYEALLTFGCLDNHTEIVMSYLAETDWDRDPSKLREIQLEIADRMGVQIKVSTASKT